MSGERRVNERRLDVKVENAVEAGPASNAATRLGRRGGRPMEPPNRRNGRETECTWKTRSLRKENAPAELNPRIHQITQGHLSFLRVVKSSSDKKWLMGRFALFMRELEYDIAGQKDPMTALTLLQNIYCQHIGLRYLSISACTVYDFIQDAW